MENTLQFLELLNTLKLYNYNGVNDSSIKTLQDFLDEVELYNKFSKCKPIRLIRIDDFKQFSIEYCQSKGYLPTSLVDMVRASIDTDRLSISISHYFTLVTLNGVSYYIENNY